MNLAAVIFDMDGVLVDSEHTMRESAITALSSYGIQPVHGDFQEFSGMGEDAFIGGVARKYGLAYHTGMKDLAYRIYVEKAKASVVVFDGAMEVLLLVKQSGRSVAVASAADWVKVTANLACIGVQEEFFDALVTGSEIARKKPHPDIFLRAAEKMKVEPSRCVVVEDALSGVIAAKSSGMRCIGIPTSFSPACLKEAGCDKVAEHLRGVFPAILELDGNFGG